MAAKKKTKKKAAKRPAKKKTAKRPAKKRVQKKTARRKTKKKVAAKRPPGRPSKYTKAVGDKICAQLAMGKSMRTVCKDPRLPSMQTVFTWLREKEGFLEQYTRAKDEAADALVDEMLDIADDGANDFYFRSILHKLDPDMTLAELDENAMVALLAAKRPETVNRSRLRVDARKWIAAKLKPKKYGDKLMHGGDEDNPIVTKALPFDFSGKT